MSNSLSGMLLILPETRALKGFVSARNQSSHRYSLWLMSHGLLRRSDKLPPSMDALHKTMD
jgi:hypothetical protein